MDYLITFGIGAAVAWLGRGYMMLRAAKIDGVTFTTLQTIKAVLYGSGI
jgi:hypothetical protein